MDFLTDFKILNNNKFLNVLDEVRNYNFHRTRTHRTIHKRNQDT